MSNELLIGVLILTGLAGGLLTAVWRVLQPRTEPTPDSDEQGTPVRDLQGRLHHLEATERQHRVDELREAEDELEAALSHDDPAHRLKRLADRGNRRHGRDDGEAGRVSVVLALVPLLILIVMAAALAQSGCTPRPAPPEVFADVELVDLVEPSPAAWSSTGQECAPERQVALVPGEAPPAGLLQDDGTIGCLAMLMPAADVVACDNAHIAAGWWEGEARAQHRGRGTDRLVCQDVVASVWRTGEGHRLEASRMRWTAAAGIALGGVLFIVGVGVGYHGAQLQFVLGVP